MKSRIRLGTALHLSSSSGNLILETDEEAKIGEDVLDSAGKPERLLGEDLFLRKRKG